MADDHAGLVGRLRRVSSNSNPSTLSVCREAADAIETLVGQRDDLSGVIDNLEYERALYVERATAAEARAQAVEGGWRPIETAPQDGTRILCLVRGKCVECFWFNSDKFESYWMDDADSEPEPTHWRPLPPPPALTPAGGTYAALSDRPAGDA